MSIYNMCNTNVMGQFYFKLLNCSELSVLESTHNACVCVGMCVYVCSSVGMCVLKGNYIGAENFSHFKSIFVPADE